jgi:DNA segregation ATPase FtsK/SpoIIIE, S-DNA-T family
MRTIGHSTLERIPEPARAFIGRRLAEFTGLTIMIFTVVSLLALASWSAQDPSFNFASAGKVSNWIGKTGAIVADLYMQLLGLAAIGLLFPVLMWGWQLVSWRNLDQFYLRAGCWVLGTISLAAFLSLMPVTSRWPLPTGMGGVAGDAILFIPQLMFGTGRLATILGGLFFSVSAILLLKYASTKPGATQYESAQQNSDRPPAKNNKKSIVHDSSERPLIDPDGEPTATIIALGAIAHVLIVLKTRFARLFSGPKKAFRPDEHKVRQEPILPQEHTSDATYGTPELNPTIGSWIKRDQGSGLDRSRPLPTGIEPAGDQYDEPFHEMDTEEVAAPIRVTPAITTLKQGKRVYREAQPTMWSADTFELPPLALLAEPKKQSVGTVSADALEQNARLLEGVLDDFGVRGEIINVRPGPVVTLYELEPAPGVKSSRVIGLAEDIARSMSAISARVAVVSGRNAIGIELPNQKRDTVYLRELLASDNFERSKAKLAICLGKTIGGESVITDLARMPHLLVAGTTGSGKSVAINTMILSLLYRLNPDQCKLIMIDPKMLELSVYDGIPHLLTPVVTDPKKAVVALKWAVREMEDRYRKMSKLGVRNIEGFNTRVAEAKTSGKTITRTVQTGFDRETGESIYEEEEFDLNLLPFIVIIVDEMADLMMVAGKDIEGAIQRLAQMARAAGIHIVMATQRPSVDVITGTIKANFPTRISFQVTSKIDSRTILGEQGAEQLLGQGDMLYMAGGGRISRVHGPFVADDEVEEIVAHLKQQGQPEYLDAITDEDEEAGDDDAERPSNPGSMDQEEAMSLYDRAVAIVLRDRKCSTSYIQRRLSVGYNKAASLVEQMEDEGVVSSANHAGKREILVGNGVDRGPIDHAEA